MELLIIRHGQSEADLLDVHEGRADFPLTELGEHQARLMAKYVAAKYCPNIILSSPLKRAMTTAQILQEQVGCELLQFADLMEYNNGVLAGLRREVAAVQYPLPKGGRPMHVAIEDGESELEFRFRAEKMLHQIIDEFSHLERVAIVSHGGFISNLLKAILQQPNTKDAAFLTGDTGMHLVKIKDRMKLVKFLNNQAHLESL